jgi:hypothetical protein
MRTLASQSLRISSSRLSESRAAGIIVYDEKIIGLSCPFSRILAGSCPAASIWIKQEAGPELRLFRCSFPDGRANQQSRSLFDLKNSLLVVNNFPDRYCREIRRQAFGL